MSTEVIPLHVALTLPPGPHELASSGFLATLAQVEDQVANLKVVDDTSAQLAASIQVRLTKAGTELERARKVLTEPFLQAQRDIMAASKGPEKRIGDAKVRLSTALTAYTIDLQKKAREAEEKRQTDLRALQEQQRREKEAEDARQAELRKKADEAAKLAAQGPRVVEMDEEEVPEPVAAPPPTETEQKIAAIQAAPVMVARAPVGVRMKVILVPIVEDVNKLPDVFVDKTAKIAAIKSTFCSGWTESKPIPVLAGVRFEISRTTESTGRQGF